MKDLKTHIEKDGTIVISNDNTTVGYAVIDKDAGELSYIFVNPAFRRRGFGSKLLKAANEVAGKKLKPADPVSPLGAKFFARAG
jgi:ribosomal protein S18 acetylase RimI-like enzyme